MIREKRSNYLDTLKKIINTRLVDWLAQHLVKAVFTNLLSFLHAEEIVREIDYVGLGLVGRILAQKIPHQDCCLTTFQTRHLLVHKDQLVDRFASRDQGLHHLKSFQPAFDQISFNLILIKHTLQSDLLKNIALYHKNSFLTCFCLGLLDLSNLLVRWMQTDSIPFPLLDGEARVLVLELDTLIDLLV